MNSPSPREDSDQGPSVRRIIGGTAFILLWTLLHLGLFYAFSGGGFLVDLFLAFIKSIMFPGANYATTGAHELLGWEGPLRTGLIFAGAAGLPCGLAICIPVRRKMLLRGFWLLLLAGLAFQVYAFSILISSALRVPA